jgi:hypothetical protein
MTVTDPGNATTGASAQLTLGWSGLTAGTRYLGRISYSNGTAEIGATLASIIG